MKRILIVGATSAIAEATAREFAQRGAALFLLGRDAARTKAIADDLAVRGASAVGSATFDARGSVEFSSLLDQASAVLGGLDGALVAHGTLPNQRECEQSVESLAEQFHVNAVSVMAVCTELAKRFEAQGSGVIAVISSVAGDRGRQSNYAYGASKAAVSAFCSGLRQRLYHKRVRVVTIKPGFVDTPMTAAFKKGLLWASPQAVGRRIARAMLAGTAVVYAPGFWRLIMIVIKCIPEFVFKRLSL